jgi:hypothetical protein
MPLDRTNGEVLDGLPPSPHITFDFKHLASLSNYTTSYEDAPKFKLPGVNYTKKRPVYEDALAKAEAAFLASGALAPVRFDNSGILVQVYPKLDMLFVIFMRRVAGEERYHVSDPYHAPLPIVLSLLSAAGRKMPKEYLQ